MIANVKARFSNGALVPLEPLDLEEGKEEEVSIEDVRSPDAEAPSILEMVDELHRSVPLDVWGTGSSDEAKNYKHYLYGWPETMCYEGDIRGCRILDSRVGPQ